MTEVRLTPGAIRILDAAADLFYARGINAVGVDAIAAASGVTKRTLYNRFGSKDALVTAYLKRRDEESWARWEARLETAQRPRALSAFDSYAYDAHPSGRGCAFLNAAAELSPAHPAFAVIRAHKTRMRSRLEQLIAEDGDSTDPPRAAEHIFLLLEGAIAEQGVDRSRAHLMAARDMAESLLAGQSAS